MVKNKTGDNEKDDDPQQGAQQSSSPPSVFLLLHTVNYSGMDNDGCKKDIAPLSCLSGGLYQ
jgi:hypothetical protein